MMDPLFKYQPLMETYLNLGPKPLASFSFVSVFAWADFFDFEFKIIHNSLCIFAQDKNSTFLYLPPLSQGVNQAVIQEVFKYMAKATGPKPYHRIENISQNMLNAFDQALYNRFTKPAEYVYRKSDLMGLSGNAYKSQRHACNSFASHYPQASLEPYQDDDYDFCCLLYIQWAHQRLTGERDIVYQAMIDENQRVHARLLKHWRSLGLIVRVLKLGQQIIGYTFGYALDEDTFCVYAEIADLRFKGAAAFMFKHFSGDKQLELFSRINTMDDFALPNLTVSKQAYHPCEQIVSYNVTLKKVV